jgi:putative ABC transport system permease protein
MMLVGLIPRYPYVGLAATAAVFWGVSMTLPELMSEFAQGVRAVSRTVSRAVGFLAADNIVKFPQRTALTVVTLGGALGMMVATATLIAGLRVATSRWIVQAFPFDFAVTSSSLASSLYSQHTVPRNLVDEVRGVAGVAAACGIRTVFSEHNGQDVMVMGIETLPFVGLHRARGVSGWARPFGDPENVRKLRAGEGVFVSENFAYLFGLKAGDRVTLKTPSGPRPATVLGTLEDYSWPHGVVIIDLDVLARLWKDDDLTYIGLRTRPGVSDREVRARLLVELKRHPSAFLYRMEDIRRLGREILDQTVALANIQVLISVVIGGLGIVNTLLISVLQRSREIGLLRAVGMTRGQVAATVVSEGVLVALVGGFVGVAEGLVGGWIPVRLFELSITGYLTPVVVPWSQALAALVAAVAVGCAASLIPARRAARLDILEAIGYE